jgi:hypothetical protein
MPESESASLLPYQAPLVRRALKALIPGKVTAVVDATAHIGCDTLNFAGMYKDAKIWAIEVNKGAFECLENNTRETTNVRAICADSVSILTDGKRMSEVGIVEPSFVYIDAYWPGGVDYWKAAEVTLTLSDQKMHDVVTAALKHTRVVILKVPFNFALKSFVDAVGPDVQVQRVGIPKPRTNVRGSIAFYLLKVARAS